MLVDHLEGLLNHCRTPVRFGVVEAINGNIKALLGHSNVSQTDTYLNAKIVGLREAMKRFDASRGKNVANEAPIEHRPLRHEETEARDKNQLH